MNPMNPTTLCVRRLAFDCRRVAEDLQDLLTEGTGKVDPFRIIERLDDIRAFMSLPDPLATLESVAGTLKPEEVEG